MLLLVAIQYNVVKLEDPGITEKILKFYFFYFAKLFALRLLSMGYILRFLIFCCCIQASYAQKIFSTSYANQADIKIFVVKYPNQADLKVYKVAYLNQAKGNEGNWYFVNYSNQSDKKVYFTQYINQADLKIYFVNYSNQAGWVTVSKKHLLY